MNRSTFGWLTAVHPDDAADSERIFRDATMRRAPFRLDYRLRLRRTAPIA